MGLHMAQLGAGAGPQAGDEFGQRTCGVRGPPHRQRRWLGSCSPNELGDQLLAQRDEILMVSGFTDDRGLLGGRFADNWELSAQRALTVTRTLMAEGLPPDAVFAAAFGPQQPVASNDDASGRALNRRVEIAPTPRPRRAAASAP